MLLSRTLHVFRKSPSNLLRQLRSRANSLRQPGQLRNATQFSDPHRRSSNAQRNGSILYGVIAVNISVFLLWKYVDLPSDQARRIPLGISQPRLRVVLWQNFTSGVDDIRQKRWWTPVTSAVSQKDGWHIFANMITLHAFSSVAMQFMAPGAFASLLFGSAVCGSLGSWYYQAQQQRSHTRSLGASGMVMGVGSAAAMMRPFERFAIMGVVPVPLIVLVGGYFAYDAFYLDSRSSRTDHAGHIGGSAFGFAFYWLFLRRFGGIRPFGS